MRFQPGDLVQLSLTISLDGTEGTMTARNLNNGQSKTATLSNNSFTCRSFAAWMFDAWSQADLTGLEMQFDSCVYSRNGGAPIAGISSSTLVNESCTVKREGNDGLFISN
ncbi:hypothetical protein INS49_011452 [Diaporthe citri]|uniref:uncharacterized protein n=1 Tax=Diaporthe citri TaxID=83186 RepID=UPI001C7EF658|nr:uncharacterized protein INS49_011452 [Diaporthe citri]KAG6360394.1 hypothetical protein INS49_011452 [Diaporthe citri]